MEKRNVLSYIRDIGFMAHAAMQGGMPREDALKMATNAAVHANLKLFESYDVLDMTTQIAASLGSAWCESGFPTVNVGQRLAASMMATRFSKDVASELRMPWRCFAISFPGVIDGDDGANVALALRQYDGPSVTLCWWGRNIGSMGVECCLQEYADITFVEPPSTQAFDALQSLTTPASFDNILGLQKTKPESLTKLHERLSKLVGRLLCGVCAEMTGFDRAISAGPPKPSKRMRSRNRLAKAPRQWVFQLARPVKVDVRRAVKEYAEGLTSHGKMTVQHCVAGHWKWQPHGKGSLLRKWIHVEPYWRGPEDAPIALRPHDLSKGGEA